MLGALQGASWMRSLTRHAASEGAATISRFVFLRTDPASEFVVADRSAVPKLLTPEASNRHGCVWLLNLVEAKHYLDFAVF